MTDKIAIATHSHSSVDHDIMFNHEVCLMRWAKAYPDQLMVFGVKGMKNAPARELILKGAIEADCTHILFLDDDHYIHESLLPLLLHNKDSAIISGLICKRSYPFQQVGWVVPDSGQYGSINLPLDGRVYDVGICAFGCTLINLDKLQKLEKPYFRDICEARVDGEVGNMRSDITLCNRFRELGEKIWIDTRVQVGHLSAYGIIYPHTAALAKKYVEDFYAAVEEETNGFYGVPYMDTVESAKKEEEVPCEV